MSKPTKTTTTQPMVVSRINLPLSRPKEEESVSTKSSSKKSVGGIGTFMLRGLLHPQKAIAGESKAQRRIEDLEIEKNSLLTLNQTLETVVKEQTHTIIDLQKRLAAIERPLTPGLDTTSSENGIMSCSDDFEINDNNTIDNEDATFERLRLMLIQLIEQAQSAVSSSPTSSDNSDKCPKVIQINRRSIATPPASPTPNKRPPSLYRSSSKSSINSTSSRKSKTPQSRPSHTPQTRSSKTPLMRDTKKWQH